MKKSRPLLKMCAASVCRTWITAVGRGVVLREVSFANAASSKIHHPTIHSDFFSRRKDALLGWCFLEDRYDRKQTAL